MNDTATKVFCCIMAAVAVFVLLGTPSRGDAGSAPPATEETAPRTENREDALPMVQELLGNHPMDRTAVSSCVYDENLHSSGELTGAGKASPAHALARLSDEREMNPIAAFWVLKEEGLYRKTPEGEGKLSVPAVKPPETEKKEYPYTAEGVRAFLTELLTLSAELDDGLALDARALGDDNAVEREQVYLEKGDCYYSYYVCYSPEAAHFLCFYLRGDERLITDAEFQLLSLRYAGGDQEALERIDQLGDRQAAALMTAAELLLTGESRAARGRIPLGYQLNGAAVTIERFSLVGSGDTGTLTNYRIRK